MQLSKSDYMLFRKHPAWLWLKKHEPKRLPAIDAGLQAIFDTGHEFEQYGESLFDGGVTLGFNDYKEYISLPGRTMQALDGGAKVIFQGRFEFENLTFICDVIEVVGDKLVDLYEIKSSTTAKKEHALDLAFQVHVLEGCGFAVRNIAVIHVNNAYERSGAIDPAGITSKTDVTQEVQALKAETAEKITEALAVMEAAECPDMSPQLAKLGSFKDWLAIYLSINPPAEGSVYELGGLNKKALDLFAEQGIRVITDIPEDLSVSKTIDSQLRARRNNGPIIDSLRIKQFLDSFAFPLYFFDYETMSSLVPYFDGMHPYAQYPFQYSLHVLESPEGELRHVEYLHSENTNPAESVVVAMKSHFGAEGSILTWNMSFEKTCNDTLAKFVPGEADFLGGLNKRIVDLMVPFSSGAYVDYRFKGSASIKNVLPVLVPTLSYKVLEIQEGGAAQRTWMQTVLDGKNPHEKDKILGDLRQYCKLDTLAMVEIYKVLQRMIH